MQRGGFQMHFQYDTNLVWCCVSQHFFMLYCTNSSSCSLWFFDVFSSYSLVINYLCNDLVCILFFVPQLTLFQPLNLIKVETILQLVTVGAEWFFLRGLIIKMWVPFLFCKDLLQSVFHKKMFCALMHILVRCYFPAWWVQERC